MILLLIYVVVIFEYWNNQSDMKIMSVAGATGVVTKKNKQLTRVWNFIP
jgi:hypothetical protein